MKVTLELENINDNRMLGVPEDVKRLEGRVTAVMVRHEIVSILGGSPICPTAHRQFASKAYIELEIDGLKNPDTEEKTVPQIGVKPPAALDWRY